MQEATDASGAARAGAAFATRRQDLVISQRELAAQKVISAPALIAFEKGRAWPRERTRALLEEVVQWPAGTLANLKAGGAVPPPTHAAGKHDDPETTDRADESGAAPLIVDAVEVAMSTVSAAMAHLPGTDDPRYAGQVAAALADLRRLETITARAVRTSSGAPAVIRALAAVRRRYDELMMAAAGAPGATVGQRLYAARQRAHLTVGEAAEMLSVPADLVREVEGDAGVGGQYTARIEDLIAALGPG